MAQELNGEAKDGCRHKKSKYSSGDDFG